MAWEAFIKTKKGRRVYDRKKKHMFNWQRASRIAFVLINDDIPLKLRDRYAARMRAGFYAYSHVMLRLYPELAKSNIRGLQQKSQETVSSKESRTNGKSSPSILSTQDLILLDSSLASLVNNLALFNGLRSSSGTNIMISSSPSPINNALVKTAPPPDKNIEGVLNTQYNKEVN